VADLADVVKAESIEPSPWLCGPYAWVLENVRPLRVDIPATGRLGLWRPAHDQLRAIEVPLMTPWDPSHDYKNWVVEYNGGKMNGFDLDNLDYGSGAPKDFAYGYARRQDVKAYWDLAREGVLGDATFADHRSRSYAGHLYPIAGASGPVDAADPHWYAADNPEYSSSCADEGFGEAIDILTGATNKSYKSYFDFKTIGDLLTKRGVSWRYYVDLADKEGTVSGYASILHMFDGRQWGNVVSPETNLQRHRERVAPGGLVGHWHLR
jgi:phospholipase C